MPDVLSQLLDTCRQKLGAANVLAGDEAGERYFCDWSDVNACRPLAVIRPASTEEVAFVMRTCNEAGQSVVVQGGMTGLCAGATPQPGEIALSLERLSGIEALDEEGLTLTALAGTPLAAVQDHADERGLHFPLDLGARGSCTVGGNIATNAGGTEVLRYGMARALVLGMEVVLADGSVLSSMNRMIKNNAGFDLKHLFIGSEGVLGIVTRVVLRLFPKGGTPATALCAVEDEADCVALLGALRSDLGGFLSSFEVMWPDYVRYVKENLPETPLPLAPSDGLLVLIECSATDPEAATRLLESSLIGKMESGLVQDAVIAQSERESADIWALREAIAEIFQHMKGCISFDVSVPIGVLSGLLARIENELEASLVHYHKVTYGHLGDSNIHLTISTGSADDIPTISDIVYQGIGAFEGSISGEHGIGVTKKPYLHLSRSSKEIEIMCKLKQLLDPNGILNPHRVIP